MSTVRSVALLGVIAAGACGGDDDGSASDGGAGPGDASALDAAAPSIDAGDPDASPPPPRLWVAFLSDSAIPGVQELYVADVLNGFPNDVFRVNGDLVSSHVTPNPRWSPDGRSLLYHAAEDVQYTHELFAAALTREGPEPGVKVHPPLQNTDGVGSNQYALEGYDWSPDGSRLWFKGRIGVEGIGVHAVQASSLGDADRLTPDDANEWEWDRPAWSPDSRTVLYLVGGDLFAVDASSDPSGEPVQVNPPSLDVAQSWRGAGFWSPDGTKIVYRAVAEEQVNLYVTTFSGGLPGETHQINGDFLDGGEVQTGRSAPFWSPDGTKVLYATEVNDRSDLHVVDMTGDEPGEPHRINGDLGVPWEGTNDAAGAFYGWAPDSTRVTFLSPRPTQLDQNELLVVDVSGDVPGAPQRVGPNSHISAWFAWSPDSSRVALLRGNALYVVDMTGVVPGTPVRVGGPAGGLVVSARFRWSPDSTRLALRGHVGADGADEIWMTAAAAPVDVAVISAPLAAGDQVWGERIEWSFDSQRLLYHATKDGALHIFLVDFSSGTPGPAASITEAVPDSGDIDGFVLYDRYWIAPAIVD